MHYKTINVLTPKDHMCEIYYASKPYRAYHLCLHHEAVGCKSKCVNNCLVRVILLLIDLGVNSPNRARVKTIDECWNLSSLHLT